MGSAPTSEPRSGSANDDEALSSLIWFQEREAGTGYYAVRMIATPRYLRIDDGDDSGDFLLFDRGERAIYSVDHENQSVLVINAKSFALDRPQRLQMAEEELSSAGSPLIDGKAIRVFRLYTNDQLCFEVAAAAGLLPGAVAALREFHLALAAEQAALASRMPKDVQSDCDLSDTVFTPDRYLRFGFPVRQRDYNGKTRELSDFDPSYRADPRLFTIPLRYRRFTSGDFPG